MTKQFVPKRASLAGSNVTLFQEKEIRKVWDDKEGKWYFSVVDIVEVLVWRGMKQRRSWVER